ncbi:2-dehydro-3-deoxygalactonokinase [Roseibium album]|uniref:2-keto-3-deoxy-galactonokinase n=1 Tax=Roseibium album TaxID=311410 RepID=A0A0M7A7R1_9HYPH|nr:2-dehydro-3-deoxygalactonokinase [Roseibium album]CTQ57571.1 2-keto-3-deoxy-galactonokinase [Roseibium album]CTQ69019.1 2-keto-3-deoxy-galactonokinase [Roseibium album]CTQ71195.1 2-keto-3-deoxy-galactonokinase [Roseibium album]
MSLQAKADWIAVDWGTTNLRVWALDSSGCEMIHRSSDKGMGGLAANEFEPALLELVADLLAPEIKTPVIVCGMAGSRQGWAEAPYKTTPCTPPSLEDATVVHAADSRLDVRILPGIKQRDPTDVMRGEETQISGFLADNPGYSGTLCLPGTHTKWVAVRDGVVEHFRTFMTGEMFALLSSRSVLRHSLSAREIDHDTFEQAVADAAENPQEIAASLFGIRAAGLIAGLTGEAARGRLSGYLIGAELAAVRDGFDLAAITLLGSDQISKAYHSALGRLGYRATLLNAETITLNGLVLAYSSYSKVSS